MPFNVPYFGVPGKYEYTSKVFFVIIFLPRFPVKPSFKHCITRKEGRFYKFRILDIPYKALEDKIETLWHEMKINIFNALEEIAVIIAHTCCQGWIFKHQTLEKIADGATPF